MTTDRREPAYKDLLGFHVTSAADAIRRSAAMQMRREHDMSLAQVRILAFIEWLQPVRLRDVAADADADKAQISRVVSSLVDRGWVERRALAGDARSAHLQLTDAGKQKMQVVMRTLATRDEHLRAFLQPAEIEQLTALLQRLRKGADGLTLAEEGLERSA